MPQAHWLSILPLLVILVLLLPPFRFHFLFAGLVGGVIAVIIGGLGPATVTKLVFDGMAQIMSIFSVMLFAATAMLLGLTSRIAASCAGNVCSPASVCSVTSCSLQAATVPATVRPSSSVTAGCAAAPCAMAASSSVSAG